MNHTRPRHNVRIIWLGLALLIKNHTEGSKTQNDIYGRTDMHFMLANNIASTVYDQGRSAVHREQY